MESDASFFDLFGQPIAWVFLAIYFIPTIVAVSRGSSARAACFFVNMLFGWTLIGWLVAVALAAFPSGASIARRAEVERARANFYLREDAKHSAN